MTVNLHAHTTRCGHASGTERDYIERAIEGGLAQFGFSDHAPGRFADGYESGFRMPMAEAQDYINTLRSLREEYRDRIRIHIGFEMEYYPNSFEKMLNFAKSVGAEYLLLGQHFTVEEYPGPAEYSSIPNDDVTKLKTYVDRLVSAIKSGVFTYIAHPDMINFTGDTSIFKEEIKKICVASREYNIPLEINFLGIRDNRNYPNEFFWQIAGEENSPVTFGFDTHDILNAFDGESLKKAKEIVKKYNLNYIGKPTIIPLLDK